jgi:Ca2+/Na+ antiporter
MSAEQCRESHGANLYNSCAYNVQILAIGIGMQDLVTNIGVAKAGLSRMAAVACLGSPLLNVQMGL